VPTWYYDPAVRVSLALLLLVHMHVLHVLDLHESDCSGCHCPIWFWCLYHGACAHVCMYL
jgi:hypothetical protein